MGWLRRRRERRLGLGGNLASRYQGLGPDSGAQTSTAPVPRQFRPDSVRAKPGAAKPVRRPVADQPPGQPDAGQPPAPPGVPHLPVPPGRSQPIAQPGAGQSPGQPGAGQVPAPPGAGQSPGQPGAGQVPAPPGAGQPPGQQGTDHSASQPGPEPPFGHASTAHPTEPIGHPGLDPLPWPSEPWTFTPNRIAQPFAAIPAVLALYWAWSTGPVGWVSLAPVYLLLLGAWAETIYAKVEVRPSSIRLRSVRGDTTLHRDDLGEAIVQYTPRRHADTTDPGVNVSVRRADGRYGMRLTPVLWDTEDLRTLARILDARQVWFTHLSKMARNHAGTTRFWQRNMWVPVTIILIYLWAMTRYAPLVLG